MKFLAAKSLALCALTLLVGVTVASPARADWDRRGPPQPYYGYSDHHRQHYAQHHRHHPPAYVARPQPRVVYVPTPMPPYPAYAAPVYYPYGWTFAFNFR